MLFRPPHPSEPRCSASEEQILADFALTELATARLIADWKTANPNRELKWPGYGRAPAEVMRLALDDLTRMYGSVNRYITVQVGIEQDTIEQLRVQLLSDT
jgi:protein-tyrosine phosphatase